MSGTMFILFEAASGYSLFEVTGLDELQAQADAVQQAVSDMNRFGRVVKLIAFVPFKSAADALEQVNAVSEATMTDELKNFLELNLPKVSSADFIPKHSRVYGSGPDCRTKASLRVSAQWLNCCNRSRKTRKTKRRKSSSWELQSQKWVTPFRRRPESHVCAMTSLGRCCEASGCMPPDS